MTSREALKNTKWIVYRDNSPLVCRTVVDLFRNHYAPQAISRMLRSDEEFHDNHTLRISIAPALQTNPGSFQLADASPAPMSFRLNESGAGEVTVSHHNQLFGFFTLIGEEWLAEPVSAFVDGKTILPAFNWLRCYSDFLVGSLRTARGFERESYVEQLARCGFTHVTVNGLGVQGPFESGPPGDVYSWFYDYSPDLDQFVESDLLRGCYPQEYLKANLEYLRSNVLLALKYGLSPGLHCNSPRSMPEHFWERYPFLRGARIDHPRESFLPRYTLAMAHPAVQQHYRELIQNILREIPELEFMHIWTNDSGAGFEFVSSLYAGRNGGPYLLREWKSDEVIANKAGENVLTYFHLLRDEGSTINEKFRLIADLGPFVAEKRPIIEGMGNQIDAGAFGNFDLPAFEEERKLLSDVGALTHYKIDLATNNVLGIPSPVLTYEILKQADREQCRYVLTQIVPRSLAPYDINSEVLRTFQYEREQPLEEILQRKAAHWVGKEHGRSLVDLWKHCDHAVRSYPAGIPYSTFAFPWFRLWVRPFVPNIDAIPEAERKYYEDYLISTFNNPTRVDLNNDMMWNFLSVREAREKKNTIDAEVLPPLKTAQEACAKVLESLLTDDPSKNVFEDLRVRLMAARCFFTTMRNTVAWIESVHGYLEAESSDQKKSFRANVWEMVRSELENAGVLLQLWDSTPIQFIPVSALQESLHIYGTNFGELLKNKIRLMERHLDDEPFIDPNYMWRMPSNLTTLRKV